MSSILDSIAAPKKTQQAKAPVSILDSFGSPQKQRSMQQTSLIGTELSRLEQLQAKVSHQMDLFPVDTQKSAQSKAQKQKVQQLIQHQQNSGETRSILESDLFRNKEDERERMIKMFTNEQLQDEIQSREHTFDGVSDTSGSINDRMNDTEAPVKGPRTKGKKGSSKGRKSKERSEEVSFDLTKTGKSKNVSFAAGAKSGQAAAADKLAQISQNHVEDGVTDIKAQFDHMRKRALEVQSGVTDGIAVEDPKLLEALMEHILFYWDDIMACLVDELVEEEVLELNRIEKIRSGRTDLEAKDELIDMLFEKKRNFSVEIPDQGFKCTREL